MLKQLPIFRVLAIAKVALLVRRHLRNLDAGERRRLAHLVGRGHRLAPAEREELRDLVSRLEPRAFALSAANHVSPIPLPRRLRGVRR